LWVERRGILHRPLLLLKRLLHPVLALLLSEKCHLGRIQLPLLRLLSLDAVCERGIVESRVLTVKAIVPIGVRIARLTVEAHSVRIGIERHPKSQSTYILFAYDMTKRGL